MANPTAHVGASLRTLRVHSEAIPQAQGAPILEPVRLTGHEGVNSLFEYELFLKTTTAYIGAKSAADLDLDSFIGREISCTIELDGAGTFEVGAIGAAVDRIGAGTREINALITDAAVLGEEGRHVQYKLTLRPWLHLATLTTDCKVFQNKTVVDILDELLADYTFPVEKRLYDTYPVRDYQVQFNESDYAFFERLCQTWGISYHFEHSEGKHRLILSDAMAAYHENASEAYQVVEFHPPGWKIDAEYLHLFTPENHLTSGRYTTRDYDYTRPRADLTQTRQDARPTGQADAEVYEWHARAGGSHYVQPRAGTAGANDPQEEGRLLALLRMQALRTHGSRAQASGNLRGMVPGCTFKLAKHPQSAANAEYLILDTTFLIEDVAQETTGTGSDAKRAQRWRVSVDLTAHPVKEPLRPALTRAKPHTRGPQSALVVGPEGQNVWTDELGRIKVQFPWDRLGQKNQNSSCWVRVSSPWAGNQLGATHLPRIGQEVIVDFIDGDPDLPICMGRVHNQNNLPSWRLPEQYALSGFRSRELTEGGGNSSAGRSNHLLMDDTPGQIQAQFKSDYLCSSISLGYITRVEDNAGRKDPRGEGFEVRTDGHGVFRAQAGALFTTEARPNAQSHAKDMGETLARLTASREQHENLSEAAQQAEAHMAGDQDEVAKILKEQNDAIRGGESRGEGHFPELAEPHMVFASPAGIESTTAGSTHIASEEHNALTSGGHTSISAGKSLLASVKQAIRLFAYESGIRLTAAAGNMDFAALKNNMTFFAKVDITMDGDDIVIRARKKLTLAGNQSSIVLDSNITGRTPGQWIEHAAKHLWVGPDNRPVPDRATPDVDLKTQLAFVMRSHPVDGRVFAEEPYTLYKDGAKVQTGVTDKQGQFVIDDHRPGTQKYSVKLANGHAFDLPVKPDLTSPADKLAARGYRADGDDASERLTHYRNATDAQG